MWDYWSQLFWDVAAFATEEENSVSCILSSSFCNGVSFVEPKIFDTQEEAVTYEGQYTDGGCWPKTIYCSHDCSKYYLWSNVFIKKDEGAFHWEDEWFWEALLVRMPPSVCEEFNQTDACETGSEISCNAVSDSYCNYASICAEVYDSCDEAATIRNADPGGCSGDDADITCNYDSEKYRFIGYRSCYGSKRTTYVSSTGMSHCGNDWVYHYKAVFCCNTPGCLNADGGLPGGGSLGGVGVCPN